MNIKHLLIILVISLTVQQSALLALDHWVRLDGIKYTPVNYLNPRYNSDNHGNLDHSTPTHPPFLKFPNTANRASESFSLSRRRKKYFTDKQVEQELPEYFRPQRAENDVQLSTLFPDHWRKLLTDRSLRPVDFEEAELFREQRQNTFEIRVISVNGSVQVYRDDSLIHSLPSNASDGVHVVALASDDGRPLLRRSFRTGEPAEGELLALCLGNLQPGNLVLVLAMFAAGDYLRSTERNLLSSLGMRGDGVGGAVKLGADFAQGTHFPPYLTDRAQLWRIWQMSKTKKQQIPYEVFKLNKNGTETKEQLRAVEDQNIAPWQGYVDSDDPSVLLSVVPEGWPPRSSLDNFRPRVHIESAVIFKGKRSSQGNLEVLAVLQKRKRPECVWQADERRANQVRFCRRYEGYGTLCRCRDPLDPRLLRRSAKSFLTSEVIPVAMLTASKTYFFYRQLISLLLAEGSAQTPILVLTDGHQPETSELAQLFGLPVREHKNEGVPGTSTPLNAHFRFSLYTAFSTYVNATKLIILEDDLIVSPDFIRYFHQTAWLLEEDPSLYVVNSFSLNSCASVAADTSRVRRSEILPQFGWMVTRDYAEEIIPYWVDNEEPWMDWDWRLYNNRLRRNRHALVPEVSRTFHSGSSGAHVTGFAQAFIFSNMIYNLDPNARLSNLHLLPEAMYDAHIMQELSGAHRLPQDFDFCDLETIPVRLRPGPALVSMYAETANDEVSVLKLVSHCLHTYAVHAADNYKGVLQYTLTTIIPHTRLYVVACPLSPFCYKLKNLTVGKPMPEAPEIVRKLDDAWRYEKYMLRTQRTLYFDHKSTYYTPLDILVTNTTIIS